MKLFKNIHFLILIICGLANFDSVICQTRQIMQIETSWKFKLDDNPDYALKNYNDELWSIISLPHTWNNLDGQDGGDNYYRGIAWYRKLIKFEDINGKNIFLKFNSVNLKADVFVNDSLVGQHIGGYSAFIFDITRFVKEGINNLIAVRVNNSSELKFAPLSGDFTFFGGITRSVELWLTNKVIVSPMDHASSGIYITPRNITSANANIHISAFLANYSESDVLITENYTIRDTSGIIVGSLVSSSSLLPEQELMVNRDIQLNHPVLWQGLDNPYLYTLETVLKINGNEIDRLDQKFGIRNITVDKDSGIYLNGKRYPLRGVAFHEDRKDKGRAISDNDRKEDLTILKETGLTFLRLAHYQHGQYTYNYCDSTGLIIWTEIPLVNEIDLSSDFASNAKEQLKELIKQNYNHPCIGFWGLFNETYNNSPDETPLVTELNQLAKTLDSIRFTSGAANRDNTVNEVPDLISWNLYYGWYYGVLNNITNTLNNGYLFNPNRISGLSEYGAGASIFDHEINPVQPKTNSHYHPEEYQNLFHEEYWKAINKSPFLWESSVWVGFDFASDSKSEGYRDGINDKGLVTRDRKVKKDAYFFYKANWSSEPVVYITSRRYIDRTDSITEIKIYSNNDSVELRVNSISYGYKQSQDHIFTWNDIILNEGNNLVRAIGKKNDIYTYDSCDWNYNPLNIYKDIKINFGTSNTNTPAGFKADYGAIYENKNNGLIYGWNENNSAYARERNIATDKKYDSFIHLQQGGKEYYWEIQLENGKYLVEATCGDPAYFDSYHKLLAENTLLIDGQTSELSPWLTAMDTVEVNDGKLTIKAADGAVNTKINFIKISRLNTSNLSVSPEKIVIGADNSNPIGFDIVSNTAWVIQCNQPWLTVNINSGNGNAHVQIFPENNPDFAAREAIITISAEGIADRTVTVEQNAAQPICEDQEFNEITGIVSDNSDSLNYGNNMNCEKLIKPDGMKNITVTFTQFKTELEHDFVSIYDGATTSSPLLGVYSGSSIPEPVSTSGGTMLITFQTDENIVDSGWNAFYTSDNDDLNYINENHNRQFTVYPNPVKQVLTIEPLDENLQSYSIELMNMSGQTIRAIFKPITPGKTLINLVSLENGIYILKISTNKRSEYLKIIKL